MYKGGTRLSLVYIDSPSMEELNSDEFVSATLRGYLLVILIHSRVVNRGSFLPLHQLLLSQTSLDCHILCL